MKIDIAREGKISREQVWLTAWCMVATADNCTHKAAPTRWADECLQEFDKRFPAAAEAA